MTDIVTAPPPPPGPPNVTTQISTSGGVSVASGQYLYSTTLTRLSDINLDPNASSYVLNNAGTIWNDYGPGSQVLVFDYWERRRRMPELTRGHHLTGDGRADIVGFGEGGTYVALGNADGTFGASQFVSGNFGAGSGAGGWASQDIFPRHLADINHDGFADLVGFGANGVYVALAHGDYWGV